MSSLMKGTAILTIGLFLSKALGLIYIFPFYALVGEENVVLYQYAYIPYNILLSIAISGAPIAVSKFVSKYNAIGDYEAGRKLVRSGLLVMIVTGIVSFIALYLLATPIANIVIKDDEQIFTVAQIAEVIRWVSFALIVVPFMSLTRGFFQGYGHYMPTSVSQLIEQIVRIIVLLGGAFVVVVLMEKDALVAINFAVFAATIGAIGGLVVLYFYWKKHQPEFDTLRATSVSSGELSYGKIYKEVITYSIPIVFVGLAISLFQLVDMFTFNSAMASIGLAAVTDTYFGMFTFLTHKIVVIPVMLATGFSMALVPAITKLYMEKNYGAVRESMDKTFQILLFITVPAAVGISLLADDIYHLLYSKSAMGAEVLANYAPVAILFALFSVTAALLQGIDYQKWIVTSLTIGVLTKLALNTVLIQQFEVNGAILATAIGYAVTILINLVVIVRVLKYRSPQLVKRVFTILLLTAIMALNVYVASRLMGLWLPHDTKLQAIVHLAVTVAFGLFVYGFLSYKIGLAQQLLGKRLDGVLRKLRLKK